LKKGNGGDHVSRWFKYCSDQGIFKAVNVKVSKKPTPVKKEEGKVCLRRLTFFLFKILKETL